MAHLPDTLLSAFVDGELGRSEAESVRAHLAGCATCTGTAALFGRLEETIVAGSLDCDATLVLLSAGLDAELAPAEPALLASHLDDCVSCEAQRSEWSRLDAELVALPAGLPSRRVDDAIAALVSPRRRMLPRVAWPSGLAAATATLVIALAVSLVPGAPPGAPELAQVEAPLVASAQSSVLDPRTNSIYVLRPDLGIVAVYDAATNTERARIAVGGRPTALALNAHANTVVVLDASTRTLTEIDTESNAVVAATPIYVAGTLTSVGVDPQGRYIVASTDAAGATAAPSTRAGGSVSIIDRSTGRVAAVRTIDVAPRLIVTEPSGARALFVSAGATSLVDATSYEVLEKLTGGVGAAFGARDTIAVLGAAQRGSRLVVTGARPTTIAINGEPRAVAALPDGGFAALTAVDDRGLITILTADGVVAMTIDVAVAGFGLSFDPSSRRFAVPSGERVVVAVLPGPVATGPQPAIPTPAPGPSQPPSVVTTPSANAPVRGARQAFGDTYVLDGKRAMALAGQGAVLWYVDFNNRLYMLASDTGESSFVVELPLGTTVTALAASRGYVFVADARAARLSVLRIGEDRVTTVAMPFLRTATAFIAARDDRFWFGTREGSLLSYDARAGRLESLDTLGRGAVTAIAADGLGRIWSASRGRDSLFAYDVANGSLRELRIETAGAVSALAADGAGTVWIGTETGEVVAMRNGQQIGTSAIGRNIRRLVADGSARIWYEAIGDHDIAYGRIGGGAALRLPAALVGLSFDAQGRAWLADPQTGGLYVNGVIGR